MKKTCNGCKALQHIESANGTLKLVCKLYYKFDPVEKVPLEECSKPKTWKALMENSRRFGGM